MAIGKKKPSNKKQHQNPNTSHHFGKWMFIPLKMVLIGIDPYPNPNTSITSPLHQKTSSPGRLCQPARPPAPASASSNTLPRKDGQAFGKSTRADEISGNSGSIRRVHIANPDFIRVSDFGGLLYLYSPHSNWLPCANQTWQGKIPL